MRKDVFKKIPREKSLFLDTQAVHGHKSVHCSMHAWRHCFFRVSESICSVIYGSFLIGSNEYRTFPFFKDIHGCFLSALLAEITNSWNKRIKSSCRGNSIPPVYLPQLPSVPEDFNTFPQHSAPDLSCLPPLFSSFWTTIFCTLQASNAQVAIVPCWEKKFVSHRTLKSTNTITHSVSQAYLLSSLSSVSSIVFTA